MAIQTSILAWETPAVGKPGGLVHEAAKSWTGLSVHKSPFSYGSALVEETELSPWCMLVSSLVIDWSQLFGFIAGESLF